MANTRKVVQIFLASPGDLQEERRAAKAAIDNFNKLWADWFGIQTELVGWEDTFKRFGRPQEQINLDLDRCEAFIGILWKKWGTPPGGKYSSGFEEEFERAILSRKLSGRPEMTLFFKTIDAEFLKDQGPDLKKVIAFRERIISQRLILFEEFEEHADFDEKLTTWITRYVQSLNKQENTSNTDNSQKQLSNISRNAETSQAAYTPLSAEGGKFVREFVTKTERNWETHPLRSAEVARFRLLATIVKVSGNDETSLGVHDANLLFRYRSSTILSRQEMEGVINSGLDNIRQEVVPLWYWYVAASARDTGYLSMSTLIGSDNQRVGALVAMRLIGEPIKPFAFTEVEDNSIDRSSLVAYWLLPTNSEQLRLAALEYLSVCGNETDIAILTKEYERRNYQTASTAADAIIRINLKQSRERAVRSMIELQPENIDARLADKIFEQPASLSSALLLEAAMHRSANVRAKVVPILIARNALSTETAERLLDDSSATVRFEALRSLKRNGREFSDEKARSIIIRPETVTGMLGGYSLVPHERASKSLWESLKMSDLRAQSGSTLEKLAAASTILNEDARFALDFKLFRTRATALRSAIDDQFQSEFNISVKRLEKLLTNAEDLNKIKSIEEPLRKEMVQKGADIICEKSEPEDLDRIRRLISDDFAPFSLLYLQYLRLHGEWQDIPLLIGLLDRSDDSYSLLGNLYNLDKVDAIAEAIYSISKGRFSELCKVKMPIRLFTRLIELASSKEIAELSDNDLIQNFASSFDEIRKAILPKAVRALPKTRLKKLLAAYLDYDGSRYYNVFYWLDLGISLTKKEIIHVTEVIAHKRR